MIVELTTKDKLFEQCREIRKKVYVEGDKIPQHLEQEHDEVAFHFLYLLNKKPVGTIRIRFFGERAKLERLSVLEEFRGNGIGIELINHSIEFCKKRHMKNIMMHARIYLKNYYSQLGFVPVGQPFLEAGIEHIKMELK